MASPVAVWLAAVVCLLVIAAAASARAGSHPDAFAGQPALAAGAQDSAILAKYGQPGLALWRAYKRGHESQPYHNGLVDTTYFLQQAYPHWCPQLALSSGGCSWCGWEGGEGQCRALNAAAKKMLADGVISFKPVPSGLR